MLLLIPVKESLTALSSVDEATSTSTSTSTRRIFYEREQGVLGIAKTAKRLVRAHSTLITRFVCNLNVRRCCRDSLRYIHICSGSYMCSCLCVRNNSRWSTGFFIFIISSLTSLVHDEVHKRTIKPRLRINSFFISVDA